MAYERLTDRDMVLNLNDNQGTTDLTKYFLFTQRLWELENQIESGAIGSLNYFKKVFTEIVAQYLPYTSFNNRQEIEIFIKSCFERARAEAKIKP